jgi:hypothetical protein
MVEQLVVAVEEGSANHREELASAEVAEHHDDEVHEGDPRPTRTLRPMPDAGKQAEGAKAEEAGATAVAEAEAAPAAEAVAAPAAEAAAAPEAAAANEPESAGTDEGPAKL